MTADSISLADLETEIAAGWAARETLAPATEGPIRTAVEETIARLDAGEARVAEKIDGEWVAHAWLKQAILLSFRLSPNKV
ncbi:MAG: 2,3,4,5-tetrahydropyridine-2,6-dicarboxylate N-succinyltransferase, partial [Caulobacteraceae bacterium]